MFKALETRFEIVFSPNEVKTLLRFGFCSASSGLWSLIRFTSLKLSSMHRSSNSSAEAAVAGMTIFEAGWLFICSHCNKQRSRCMFTVSLRFTDPYVTYMYHVVIRVEIWDTSHWVLFQFLRLQCKFHFWWGSWPACTAEVDLTQFVPVCFLQVEPNRWNKKNKKDGWWCWLDAAARRLVWCRQSFTVTHVVPEGTCLNKNHQSRRSGELRLLSRLQQMTVI